MDKMDEKLTMRLARLGAEQELKMIRATFPDLFEHAFTDKGHKMPDWWAETTDVDRTTSARIGRTR